MRAFVIRPFGEKAGIDFDRVEAELIAPALARLEIDGVTTGEVIEAGNIREDMLQLLLVADVVLADISLDSPNAYYELGIRHALRQRRTVLLRASSVTSSIPFDLQTHRYLAYDAASPADALDSLCDGLKATIASDHQDSPVFRMLPELREQQRSTFLPVPRAFREEVEYAEAMKLRGKLSLLGLESKGAVWESEGLRLVARAQFNATTFEAAAVTLEELRAIDPDDAEANLMLGTVYHRLGNLARSDEALRRVVSGSSNTARERAEAAALLGRYLKSQWCDAWRTLPPGARRAAALESTLLTRSYEAYSRAFCEDLNHYLAGLSALAMLTITLELATHLPERWAARFASDNEAQRTKAMLDAQHRMLAGAVWFAIQASREKQQRGGRVEPWVSLSLAEFGLLNRDRPGAVLRAYQDALEGQRELVSDAVRSQLVLYHDLDLFSDEVPQLLALLGRSASTEPPTVPRTILFTGHQVDAPDRAQPRFPNDKAPLVREAIRKAVATDLATYGTAVGIAGAASGGDILFHEVCAELGISTTPYLALPPDAYVRESVARAEGDWVARFRALQQRHPGAPILAGTRELPGWLRHRKDYSIWQRANLWMLNEALAAGAGHVTVLALWDGRQQGDGPGGTADMIAIARARGAETRVLDTNEIFAVGSNPGPAEK